MPSPLRFVAPPASHAVERARPVALAAGLLTLTAFYPLLQGQLSSSPLAWLPLALAASCGAVAGAVALKQRWRGVLTPGDSPPGRAWRHSAHGLVDLGLHLSPVLLLSVAFPLASRRMAGTTVGGAHLTAILLASSLTVPWLSQSVCMPLYRALGSLTQSGSTDAVRRRFVQAWAAAAVQALPVVALFTGVISLATSWSVTAMSAYALLCLLHAVFAQSLVPTNVNRQRRWWVIGWTSYAAALLAAPTVWFLPPLLGTLSQLVPLRGALLERPVWLDPRDGLEDLLRGLLLGAVLWADKFFLFLRLGDRFAVITVFLALLPAIVTYNYYFCRLAPVLDRAVLRLRHAMETEPAARLAGLSDGLYQQMRSAVTHVGLVGGLMTLLASVTAAFLRPDQAALVGAVATASWIFMMTTLLCYLLDFLGEKRSSQLFSAAHLVVCALVFIVWPPGHGLYLCLAYAELVVLATVLKTCFARWRTPEYTLFWRHATAW